MVVEHKEINYIISPYETVIVVKLHINYLQPRKQWDWQIIYN